MTREGAAARAGGRWAGRLGGAGRLSRVGMGLVI